MAQETAGAVILSKVQDSPTCEKCTLQNPAALYCLDCGEFLCNDCELVHQRWKDFQSHNRIALTDLPKHDLCTLCPPVHISCPRHHLQMGSHYCLSCRQFGCYKCEQHLHYGPQLYTLDKAARKRKESLTKSMEPATDAVTHLEEHIQEVKLVQDKLKEHADKARASINVAYDDISETLKKHKQTLLAQVDAVVATKSTLMCIQNEKLEEKRDELSSTLKTTELSLETYSDPEILAAADLYETALTEKVDDYKSLLPLSHADNFLEVAITPLVQLPFGVVNGGCCPAATTIVGYQTDRIVRGRERIFVVEARDESGCPYGRGGEEVSFAFVSSCYSDESRNIAERTREMKTSNVVDCGNGRYTVSVTAPLSTSRYESNAYDLFVNVRMLPIKSSPIKIYARNERNYSEIASVNYKTLLPCSPACVAPGHNTVYVTTYQSHQIYKMSLGWSSNRYDKVLHPITVAGAKNLQAIATLGGSTLFVTDCGSNEVIKLAENGEVQARFGKKGSEKGQFDEPNGLAVDEEGRIFVGESGNKRIQVFNPDSSHRLTIPLPDQVQRIALDTSCNIHATQFSTGCIKVYSSSGQYVREYGKGQLDQPHNVFVDEEDFCFVTDRGPNPVKIFDQQGTLIHSFGSEVKFADGVCISPYGEEGTFVYVCDREEKLFIRY